VIVWLVLIGFTVANAAFRYGGGGTHAWSVNLLLLGLAGGAFLLINRQPDSTRSAANVPLALALLLPLYVALQLIPLPLFLLDVISPERAEIARGLGAIGAQPHFAPLTLNIADTVLHLSRIAGYVLVFFVTQRLASRARNPWPLVLPLVLIAGAETFFGLSQFFANVPVVSGTFLNRNHFSNLLAMVLPFLVMGAWSLLTTGRDARKAGRSALAALAAAATAAAILTAILVSSSRMGFFSAMGGLAVMAALLIPPTRSRATRWTWRVGLVVAGLFALLFLPSDSFVQEFTDIPTDGRGPIWRDSLSLIGAYPLVGSGLHTYYPGLLRYQTVGLQYAWSEAHNDYLQLLAELGIVGFLLPALLVVIVYRAALRTTRSKEHPNRRHFAIACLGGATALLLHSLADFNLYVPANAMTFAWILGLAAGTSTGVVDPILARAPGVATPFLKTGMAALSLFAVLYAGGWLVYLHTYRDNPTVEAAFCRVGICESDRILAVVQRERGAQTIAHLPPDELRTFLRRDPANPHQWRDLGESLQMAGRTDEARLAVARSLELGPRIPYVLFKAAQFHLSNGDVKQSLQLTKRAIEGDPSRTHVFLQPFWAAAFDAGRLLREGVPDDPIVLRQILRQRTGVPDVGGSRAVWARMLERGHTDAETAGQYVEFLMRSGSATEGWAAWNDYTRTTDLSRPEGEHIFNGTFEMDPAQTRFDWRTRVGSSEGRSVGFDRSVRYSGERSLRLVFEGTTNPTDLGVRQVVFLEAGTYRLAAYVRTEALSTDQGVAFTLVAEGAPALLNVTTRDVRGTNDWTLIEQTFDAPPGGGFIQVNLTRQRSFRLENMLSGTVWVDQVSITPAPAP